jgi:hypothetical protein
MRLAGYMAIIQAYMEYNMRMHLAEISDEFDRSGSVS